MGWLDEDFSLAKKFILATASLTSLALIIVPSKVLEQGLPSEYLSSIWLSLDDMSLSGGMSLERGWSVLSCSLRLLCHSSEYLSGTLWFPTKWHLKSMMLNLTVTGLKKCFQNLIGSPKVERRTGKCIGLTNDENSWPQIFNHLCMCRSFCDELVAGRL